jgi:hypothetical protein
MYYSYKMIISESGTLLDLLPHPNWVVGLCKE